MSLQGWLNRLAHGEITQNRLAHGEITHEKIGDLQRGQVVWFLNGTNPQGHWPLHFLYLQNVEEEGMNAPYNKNKGNTATIEK